MQELISIIVPVYNVENCLKKCLDSILNQTYQNIEIICVNDGSPDNSAVILRQYAEKDKRVCVVTQNNQGLSGARNTGLKYVHGKYIMFVDSDDWIDEETCEIAINAAEQNCADLIMWSYVREFESISKEKYMFWENGRVFDGDEVKIQLHRRICGLLGEELRNPEYANAFETVWGKLYLAENIIENHIEFVDTREIGTEDALFNLYTLGYTKRAVYLRKCFYHYRKTNEGSLTSNYKKHLFEQWSTLFSYMERYIQENQLGEVYFNALNNRIALSILGLGLNIMSADISFFQKRKLLSDIVNNPQYINAYKTLDYQYFPVKWKVFYICAKYKFVTVLYLLLGIIRKIIYG